MTVRVSVTGGLGGGGAVTHFEDTFNRASGNLGGNWVQLVSPWTPITNPVMAATASISLGVDLGQVMLVSNVGTTNPGMQWSFGLLAMPIYMSNFGKSQFSEWKLVILNRIGANDVGTGPAVLFQNPGQQSVGAEQQGMFGYWLLVVASTHNWQLRRGNTIVNTLVSSGGPFADGDVLRLEAKINPGDVTLTVKQNGATVNTTVDNTGARILTGSPGMFGTAFDGSAGGAMSNQWRNFKGGLL